MDDCTPVDVLIDSHSASSGPPTKQPHPHGVHLVCFPMHEKHAIIYYHHIPRSGGRALVFLHSTMASWHGFGSFRPCALIADTDALFPLFFSNSQTQRRGAMIKFWGLRHHPPPTLRSTKQTVCPVRCFDSPDSSVQALPFSGSFWSRTPFDAPG